MFIAMVLTKLNSPLRLNLACLLDTFCTIGYKCFRPSSRKYFVSMSPFLRIVPYFLLAYFKGRVCAESNYVVP